MLYDVMKHYMDEIMDMDFYATDRGFVNYKVNGEEFYIEAMCMAKDASKKETGDFFRHIIEIAKKNGCTYLSGNIDSTRAKATQRLLAHIRRGYKVVGVSTKYITVVKEI